MTYIVQKLGTRGEGVVDHLGKTIFVPKVLAHEEIELNDGKLSSIVKPSQERIAPICKFYQRCGGCGLQHWHAEPYSTWKRDLVVKALADHEMHPDVSPLVSAHGAGRRRATFHVRKLGSGWEAGFMEMRSHDLCAIDQCPILVPALDKSAEIASAIGSQLGACDVSFTAADNGLDVSVKAERKLTEGRQSAMAELLVHFKLARLSVNGEIAAAGATPFVVMGNVRVNLPAHTFLQATTEGENTLAKLVLAGLGKSKHVADLFCGLGPFALRIAATAKVYAADTDRAAIESLKTAIRLTQGLKPMAVETRDLFKEPLVSSELKDFDAVVFDPPRAGAEAQAKQLARGNAKTIVAVSCDPQTLARDAAILVSAGYIIKNVTPVDQFKWSSHVETVMVLKK